MVGIGGDALLSSKTSVWVMSWPAPLVMVREFCFNTVLAK